MIIEPNFIKVTGELLGILSFNEIIYTYKKCMINDEK